MSGDLTRVDEWLYDTLHGDAILSNLIGGRIYGDQAPQGATFPLVLYAFLGGADKILTLTSRLTNSLYLIRAVDEGSTFTSIEAVADRMDEILSVPEHGVIVRDIRISSCQREQPHQRKDMENGVPVVYLGGFYRIKYQPASQ